MAPPGLSWESPGLPAGALATSRLYADFPFWQREAEAGRAPWLDGSPELELQSPQISLWLAFLCGKQIAKASLLLFPRGKFPTPRRVFLVICDFRISR